MRKLKSFETVNTDPETTETPVEPVAAEPTLRERAKAARESELAAIQGLHEAQFKEASEVLCNRMREVLGVQCEPSDAVRKPLPGEPPYGTPHIEVEGLWFALGGYGNDSLVLRGKCRDCGERYAVPVYDLAGLGRMLSGQEPRSHECPTADKPEPSADQYFIDALENLVVEIVGFGGRK